MSETRDADDDAKNRIESLERELAEERESGFRTAEVLAKTHAAHVKAQADLQAALAWTDDDKELPEDDAIRAAHPMNSGRHDIYAKAMRLVGAKRSKGALVDLVNWLLNENEKK